MSESVSAVHAIADPLDKLRALRAIETSRAATDSHLRVLRGEAIAQARADGHRYSDIGEALAVSAQRAAQLDPTPTTSERTRTR